MHIRCMTESEQTHVFLMFNSRCEGMHMYIRLLNVVLSSSECPNVGERLVIDRNLWFAAFIIWHSVLLHTSLSILQEQGYI